MILKDIIVDNEIKLIPYYECYDITFKWYQDLDVVKQVDNIDTPYDLKLLKNMYNYLNENGYLFYINYNGTLVGDITLEYNNDIAIVVSKEYQNKHIGRKSVLSLIKFAKELGYDYVRATIYSFNKQSIKMFESIGFIKESEEEYFYRFK